MSVGDTRQIGASLPEICGQQNIRATVRENKGQNIQKGHTPSPRKGIKIPDPAENRTRAAGLESRGLYRPRHGDRRVIKHKII